MSFDEIQSIWDSQSLSNGAIDQDKLLPAVIAKERSLRRISTITDIVMTLTLLFLAAMFVRDPLLEGHDLVLILPGCVCVFAAGLVWNWRAGRQRRQLSFDDSLRGVISRSMDAIDDRICLMRNFLWWFACPNALGLIVALFIIDPQKQYLLWMIFIPAFVFCMGLAWWQIRREIRLRLQPERDRLASLRSQLDDPVASA